MHVRERQRERRRDVGASTELFEEAWEYGRILFQIVEFFCTVSSHACEFLLQLRQSMVWGMLLMILGSIICIIGVYMYEQSLSFDGEEETGAISPEVPHLQKFEI